MFLQSINLLILSIELAILSIFIMFSLLRLSPRVPARTAVRWNSTAPATPPLMSTLRADLKTAMRAKDTARYVNQSFRFLVITNTRRLNVLRALIAETSNAAKTSTPIKTDVQLLSLIRKRVFAARDNAQQFAEASRSDLKEQEDAQAAILEEYAGQIKTMSAEEIKEVIAQQVALMKEAGEKPTTGLLFKALFKPGGALDGKTFDQKEVAELAKEAL